MFLQSIKMAWNAISSNKMRSFLTMLGIIIGVMALVVMVSLVNGATDTVTSEIQSMGNDMLIVSVRDDEGNPIRFEELDDIASLQILMSALRPISFTHRPNTDTTTRARRYMERPPHLPIYKG